MGKSIFTILFLIAGLLVVAKIKSFIANNRTVEVPQDTFIDQTFKRASFMDYANYEAEPVATSTDFTATSTDFSVATTTGTSTPQ